MCSPFIKPSTTCLSSQWPPLINFELKPLPPTPPTPHTRPLAAKSSQVSALSERSHDEANSHTFLWFHCILHNTRLNCCSGCSCPPSAHARIVAASHPIHPSLQQTHTGVYEWEIQGKQCVPTSRHKMLNKYRDFFLACTNFDVGF